MDFNDLDIRRFLVDSIPVRFGQLSPSEFESFIGYLFQVDGYDIEYISNKSDPTAHLIATKDGSSLVIRVLRLEEGQLIREREIQEAAAARDFYQTDQSWLITTTGFTEEAKSMADSLDIELWDWEALNQALSDLFFEGKSYQDYTSPIYNKTAAETKDPVLKLKVKWEAQEGVGLKWYNLNLTISNPTDENYYIYLDFPVLIDNKKNQTSAEKWVDGEFVAGMIYAGASIRTNALFKTSKLGERPPGGKIIVSCHEREPPVTYHLTAKLKGEACYFVTYCYSRQSSEYAIMVRFRDEVLYKTISGRIGISLYYFLSPFFIRIAPQNKVIDRCIRKLTSLIVNNVRKGNFHFMKMNSQ